jgi:pyridoxamine 5'-phosphate oxidase
LILSTDEEPQLTPDFHGSIARLSLPELLTRLWQELASACNTRHRRQHPWRSAVLATTGADGWPNARTVVLRECDVVQRRLVLFTDSRAAKVHELQADAKGMLVLWSPALGWQLRLRVQLQASTAGAEVDASWARLKVSPAAQDYLSPLPPGAVVPSAVVPGAVVTGEAGPAAENTVHHFAVVQAQVISIDWLALQPQGHRRARFDEQGARWLVP